ncbi:MAG: sigma factor, ECF subfamily protein [Candidatus Eremiobacteraeota bacterium]|nr:sigma factor, ECF subfamily protein [Candidatus Eremiobacteraeota bacterium]
MDPREHLFRREAGRMVATLTRIFGVRNLALAEDVVQDAFCRALEVWRLRGIPDNPSAWLMKTAKNRAIDILRRERTARTFAPELGCLHESEWTLVPTVAEFFNGEEINDDQLRMMFSCCHPRLPEQAQVALILHLSCGFSVAEIANAFLSGRAATEKRITRAKHSFSASKGLFDLRDRDVATRLSAVLRALYLLFNEGYHGASTEAVVRRELCHEAMRLVAVVRGHPVGATPATFALSALMCFNAARLPARLDTEGNLTSLFHQDRSRWNRRLIAEGRRLLDLSATGPNLSEYHIEAAIASVHACAAGVEDTDWKQIVSLYDNLMALRPSPVIALNRAIALAQQYGPGAGLEAIRSIERPERLAKYPFYWAALGELEFLAGSHEEALRDFRSAASVARNAMERRFFERRAEATSAWSG